MNSSTPGNRAAALEDYAARITSILIEAMAALSDDAAGATAATPPPSGQPHRALWDAANAEATPGKALARRAGFASYHSGIRQALADMARGGQLVKTPDGYRRG